MADRGGIFVGDNPFEISRRWLDEAKIREMNDPNAAALATVDENGAPNVRIILVKAIEDDAFVFFTNYNSRKGRDLKANPMAALDLHWKSLERQIRVRGTVVKESAEKSDAYFHSRDHGSRIGAWASAQSETLSSKGRLIKAVAEQQVRLGLNPPRPPHWGGFRIVPFEFEFWAAGKFRIHDRFRWSRNQPADPWKIERLFP